MACIYNVPCEMAAKEQKNIEYLKLLQLRKRLTDRAAVHVYDFTLLFNSL